MGYDLTYHLASQKDIEQVAFAPMKSASAEVPSGVSASDETAYTNILKQAHKLAQAEQHTSFDRTYGFLTAQLLQLTQPSHYVRGLAFSFLVEIYPQYRAYTTPWTHVSKNLPGELRPHNNAIFENYTSGMYLAPAQAAQLLKDYNSNEVIKLELDCFFDDGGKNVFLPILTAAAADSKGILEATDVVTPDPKELLEKTLDAIQAEPHDSEVFAQEQNLQEALREEDLHTKQEILETISDQGKQNYLQAQISCVHSEGSKQNPDAAAIAYAGYEAYRLQALCARRNRDIQAEIKALEKAVSVYPLNYVDHADLAVLYEKQSDIPQAVQAIEQALELNPGNPHVNFNASIYYRKHGAVKKQLQALDTALRTNQYPYNYLDQLVRAVKTEKQLSYALSITDRLLKEATASGVPEHIALTQSAIATILATQGDQVGAVERLETVVTTGHPTSNDLYDLSRLYLKINKVNEAIDTLKQLENIDPNYILINALRGYIYIEQKEYAKAIRSLESSYELSPNAHDAVKIAFVYDTKLNAFSDAALWYQKSLDLDPNIANTWYGLGYAQEKLKKYNEATTAYKKAIELKPDTMMFYYALGACLFSNQQYEEAITQFEIALKHKHRIAWTNDWLGQCYEALGNKTTAHSYYKTALQDKPDAKMIQEHVSRTT